MFSKRFVECKKLRNAMELADNDFRNGNFSQASQKYNHILSMVYNYVLDYDQKPKDVVKILKIKINTCLEAAKINGEPISAADNSDDENEVGLRMG